MIACALGVLEGIAEHARRDAPRECCGLLIGDISRIDVAVPVQNRADDPVRRYEIDPRDYLAAIKQCRGTSRTVIGAYHSHFSANPEPSPSDRAEAVSYFLYLIAGPVAGDLPLQVRAYRMMDGNFQPIVLVPDAKDPET